MPMGSLLKQILKSEIEMIKTTITYKALKYAAHTRKPIYVFIF